MKQGTRVTTQIFIKNQDGHKWMLCWFNLLKKSQQKCDIYTFKVLFLFTWVGSLSREDNLTKSPQLPLGCTRTAESYRWANVNKGPSEGIMWEFWCSSASCTHDNKSSFWYECSQSRNDNSSSDPNNSTFASSCWKLITTNYYILVNVLKTFLFVYINLLKWLQYEK